MHQCHICLTRTHDTYRIDEYDVCEACLMQGRLDELPAFARAVSREQTTETERAATVSSWWNRDIPTGVAH